MIDSKDCAILKALQENGRLSNVELAEIVHLSPAACYQRTKKLHSSGYIRRFTAAIDPHKVSRPLLAFIGIVLDRSTLEIFKPFSERAMAMPEILECHIVAGGFDYILMARLKDMNHYNQFLNEALAEFPGIRQTHTYFVTEEIKTGAPLDF